MTGISVTSKKLDFSSSVRVVGSSFWFIGEELWTKECFFYLFDNLVRTKCRGRSVTSIRKRFQDLWGCTAAYILSWFCLPIVWNVGWNKKCEQRIFDCPFTKKAKILSYQFVKFLESILRLVKQWRKNLEQCSHSKRLRKIKWRTSKWTALFSRFVLVQQTGKAGILSNPILSSMSQWLWLWPEILLDVKGSFRNSIHIHYGFPLFKNTTHCKENYENLLEYELLSPL